jgi:hypothetical protein
MEHCSICRFYDENPRDNDPNRGQCRFNPPPFPVVENRHWCGRFAISVEALKQLWDETNKQQP